MIGYVPQVLEKSAQPFVHVGQKAKAVEINAAATNGIQGQASHSEDDFACFERDKGLRTTIAEIHQLCMDSSSGAFMYLVLKTTFRCVSYADF